MTGTNPNVRSGGRLRPCATGARSLEDTMTCRAEGDPWQHVCGTKTSRGRVGPMVRVGAEPVVAGAGSRCP